jgi:hypothetical protein
VIVNTATVWRRLECHAASGTMRPYLKAHGMLMVPIQKVAAHQNGSGHPDSWNAAAGHSSSSARWVRGTLQRRHYFALMPGTC